MKKLVLITTACLCGVLAIQAQEFKADGRLYQVLGPSISGLSALDEGFSTQVVRGKPFMATEERHSIQILRNGTRIENSQKNRLFRDGQGRTRVEAMDGTATIFDPVAGFRAELNPAAKTARRANANALTAVLAPSRPQPTPSATNGVMPETT